MNSILILGANSDIAIAIARKFASHNYNLLLAGRSLNPLKKLQNDFAIKYNVVVDIVDFDAGDFESHKAFLNNLPYIPPITICSFGYLGVQELAERQIEETSKIINSNYTGAVSILNHVSNYYESQKKGIIVGISSVAGDRGRQSNYIYGSAKAGFSAYLSGLRNRLYKHKCHVLEVKPGFVATKMTEGLDLPAPLTATPEQVASKIFAGVRNGSNVIYVLGLWRWIMLVIRNIPEFIFKRLNL